MIKLANVLSQPYSIKNKTIMNDIDKQLHEELSVFYQKLLNDNIKTTKEFNDYNITITEDDLWNLIINSNN